MMTKDENQPFARELAAFEQRKAEFMARAQGQFIVAHDETIIGPYSTYADAYREGLTSFGNVPILIKQVLPEDPVQFAPTVGIVASNVTFLCQYSI